MKPRFLIFIIALAALFALLWSRPSDAKTVAGNLNLALTISTNQADGLDWAVAKFNASQAGDTNFVALSATQYLAARNYDILNSYASSAAAEREAKHITDFRNATEAKRIASENAAK